MGYHRISASQWKHTQLQFGSHLEWMSYHGCCLANRSVLLTLVSLSVQWIHNCLCSSHLTPPPPSDVSFRREKSYIGSSSAAMATVLPLTAKSAMWEAVPWARLNSCVVVPSGSYWAISADKDLLPIIQPCFVRAVLLIVKNAANAVAGTLSCKHFLLLWARFYAVQLPDALHLLELPPWSISGDCPLHTYIHTYTLFVLEIYRVAVELMYSRK